MPKTIPEEFLDTDRKTGSAEEDVAGRKSEACAGRKRLYVGSMPSRSKASLSEPEWARAPVANCRASP